MKNDPLGLFEESGSNTDPLGLFSEGEKPSTLAQAGKDALGGLEAVGTMIGGLPSYIYSGYQGLGHLMTGGSPSSVGDAVRQAQETNFGFGAPTPISEAGKTASEMLSHGLETVRNTAGEYGEKYGGNLGRMNAEIAADTLMNFLPLPGGKMVRRLGEAVEKRLPGKEVVPEVKLPEVSSAPKDPLGLFEESPNGTTPMQKQMALREAMDSREQVFADKNNVQGELDLRPKQMPLDENGMPVDMQRSMDAQKEYAPEQTRLFDEDQRASFEVQRARELEAAQAREANIEVPVDRPDYSAEIEAAYKQREEQIRQQRIEEQRVSQEESLVNLEQQLREQAYKPVGDGQGPKTRAFKMKGNQQRGGIKIQSTEDGFKAVDDNGTTVGYLRSNLTPKQSKMLGETANVDIVKATEKGKGVGKALYEAWNDAHEGRIAPSGKTSPDAWKVWKRNFPTKVDEFVKQEAQRLHDGAPRDVVLGNITDPAIAQRVLHESQKSYIRVPETQRGAIDMEAVTKGLQNLTGRKVKTADGVGKVVSSRVSLMKDIKILEERLRKASNQSSRAYLSGQETSMDNHRARSEALHKKILEDWRHEPATIPFGRYKVQLEDGTIKGYDGKEINHVFEGPMRSPGGKQTGAVDFSSIVDGINKLFTTTRETPKTLQEVIANNKIPKDVLPKDTITEALKEGKDTSAWDITKKTSSGSTLEAMSRRSALVRDVSRTVQNAIKRADLYIRTSVLPVETAFRKMSKVDTEALAKVFKSENENHRLLRVEELEGMNLSEKQMDAYASMRKLNQDTLTIQNEARGRLGLEPISNKEYHVASRWRGDYRQPVYDKQGRLTWYLAADSRYGLKKQAEALLKEHPDLIIDPKKGHVTKSGGAKNDVQMMYSTMLDVLGRDNPAVQAMKEVYETAIATETSSALGQTKHAERKADIRGFVGDRPGFSPKNEALEMFQEQIQHAKNAYKWSTLQEAGSKLKEVFSNEELAAQQPKNMEYAKDYYQNALGHGTAKWVAALENAFRELGVSPSVLDKAIGTGKSVFITQKLAVSLGNSIVNLLQVVNTVPHLIDQMVKGGGNPLTALPLGMLTGVAMASGHYLNKLGGNFEKILKGSDNKSIHFLNEAFKYAEDNGITSRSVYDESPINKRGIITSTAQALGQTLSIPETLSRSAAYMSFVQMLKDSKKFKTNEEIFQRAEELTNATMVDYRASERPMGFANLGVAGNALNTLQTFPINLLNQYRYFFKEAGKGNVAPLLAIVALQYAMAGASGVPGFNDMDKFIGWAKEKLPDSAWEKVKDFDPKVWMLEHLDEASVYGALSTETGVSMTNRLTAPGLADMAVSPAAPLTDLAKQAGNVVSAVADPGDPTKRAQAIHSVTPTGLQGLVETKVFPEQFSIDRPNGTKLWKKANDLESRTGQYVRTPEEETLRTIGLRSQREAMSNEMGYKIGQMTSQVTERSKGLIDKYYAAVQNGNMARANELNTLYTKLNGNAISNAQMETQLMDEYTSALEKSVTAAKKLEALKGMARIRDIMEKRDAKYNTGTTR